MKRNVEITIAALFFLLGVAMIVVRVLAGCYRGDPGYPPVDYPPEPPFSETCTDAGAG